MTIIAVSILIVPPVAYVISGAFSRVPMVRSYLHSLVDPRGVIKWCLIALVFVPVLVLFSNLISRLLGRGTSFMLVFGTTGFPLIGLVTVKFLYQLFFYSATGEEAGWSGFARHRLQTHISPLLTALIVCFFWALWHAFVWYAEGQHVLTVNYWIDTYINLLPSSIILTWLYNRGKGSILVVGIGHAAANTIFDTMAGIDSQVFTVIIYCAALTVILIDKMWRKLTAEHPAVFQPVSEAIPLQEVFPKDKPSE